MLGAPAATDRTEVWQWEATPCPRSGVATESARLWQHRSGESSFPMSEVRGGGREELPHLQGAAAVGQPLSLPMNSTKRQNDRILKEELPRSAGAQYATGDQWRNNSRKNEETESKQKQHPVVDVTGDGSNVRCCKEQYCMGTWNVRSMNQG